MPPFFFAGNLPAANAANETTEPSPPTGFAIERVQEHSVTLAWTKPDDSSITGYEYGVNHNDTFNGRLTGWQWTAIPNMQSHTIDNLAPGKEYRFKLRAVNDQGNSQPAPGAAPWYLSAEISEFQHPPHSVEEKNIYGWGTADTLIIATELKANADLTLHYVTLEFINVPAGRTFYLDLRAQNNGLPARSSAVISFAGAPQVGKATFQCTQNCRMTAGKTYYLLAFAQGSLDGADKDKPNAPRDGIYRLKTIAGQSHSEPKLEIGTSIVGVGSSNPNDLSVVGINWCTKQADLQDVPACRVLHNAGSNPLATLPWPALYLPAIAIATAP